EDSPRGYGPLPPPTFRRLRFRDARRLPAGSHRKLAGPAHGGGHVGPDPQRLSQRGSGLLQLVRCDQPARWDPFTAVPKANEEADPRRQRRAMTEEELTRLLAVARERPLIEAQTVRKGPRKGERYADVRPEVRERLEQLGRERRSSTRRWC